MAEATIIHNHNHQKIENYLMFAEFTSYKYGVFVNDEEAKFFLFPFWFSFPALLSEVLEEVYGKPVHKDILVVLFQLNKRYRTYHYTVLSKIRLEKRYYVKEWKGLIKKYFVQVIKNNEKLYNAYMYVLEDYVSVLWQEPLNTYESLVKFSDKFNNIFGEVINDTVDRLSDFITETGFKV